MSVYKRNRTKSKIDFYDKAERLNDRILDLTDDARFYSKRQTFRRAIPIMELSRTLLVTICIANENLPQCWDDYIERRKNQILAIGYTDALLRQFQSDCKHMKTIPGSKKKEISDLAVELKDLLLAWKKSDESRYTQKFNTKL